MFLIKHGKIYITSQALAEVEKRGDGVRLVKMDGSYIILKTLDISTEGIQKAEYIVECIADAVADMAAQEAVRALMPPPSENPRVFTTISVPVPSANDMILDIDDVIEEAEEEFEAWKNNG